MEAAKKQQTLRDSFQIGVHIRALKFLHIDTLEMLLRSLLKPSYFRKLLAPIQLECCPDVYHQLPTGGDNL